VRPGPAPSGCITAAGAVRLPRQPSPEPTLDFSALQRLS
jgi:hypothetical protein